MSTSEFDQSSSGSEPDHFAPIPDDFTDEDVAFASKLQSLFPLDEEEVPPLFVQTLLTIDDERFQSVDDGFEHKVRAHVLRRLQTKRRLFSSSFPSTLKSVLFPPVISRSVLIFMTACMLFMFTSMAVTSPLFASGWDILWSGTNSGALQVNHYPTMNTTPLPVPASNEEELSSRQISLIDTQSLLHFPLFWPHAIPERYSQSNIYVYPGEQSWSDGPIVVLTFTYSSSDGTVRQITICQFKPQGKVLQVVEYGAAQQIKIDREGNEAIYIEGQWKQDEYKKKTPSWVYSDRSELIYEDSETGVVFWIVGDKRDGIDQQILGQIANSLAVMDWTNNKHMGGRYSSITHNMNNMPWPFANDVIYLDDPDNPDGPSFRLVDVGSQPQAEEPEQEQSNPALE